jgi:peptide/nickel transport system substrate-binding protein
MTIGTSFVWRSFDLQVDESAGNYQYVLPAYDRLVDVGPGNKVVPYLAKSWTVTPRSVTFKLRTDATCDDGTKITPLVVAQSFERLVTVSKFATQLIPDFGPGPYTIKANRYKGTFTFGSKTPNRNILRAMTVPFTSIICPAGLAALKTNPNALQTAMYGSGPYELVSAEPAVQARYKLRPNWNWGPNGTTAKGLPNTLVIQVLNNQTTAANELVTGALDLARISGPDVARLISSKSLQHKVSTQFASNPIVFNMRPGHPTTDLALRKALMTAIDPNDLNQAEYAGRAIAVSSVFPPGSECYDPRTTKLMPHSSISAAKAILASAGYTLQGGTLMKDGAPVKLKVLSTSSVFASAGEYLDSVFSQLGIQINLVTDPVSFGGQAIAGNFDVVTSSNGVSTAASGPGLGLFLTAGPTAPAGYNLGATGIGDPAFQKALNQGFETLGKSSCAGFDQVQELYLTKYYLYPGSVQLVDWFAKKGVQWLPLGSGLIEVAYLTQS